MERLAAGLRNGQVEVQNSYEQQSQRIQLGTRRTGKQQRFQAAGDPIERAWERPQQFAAIAQITGCQTKENLLLLGALAFARCCFDPLLSHPLT